MIHYIGKKLVYFLTTWPLFSSSEEKIKEEKVIRKFLWWGIKEMKKDIKSLLFRKKNNNEEYEDE